MSLRQSSVAKISIMRTFALVVIIFFAQVASAQVLINEVQIAPINERFIELYNSGDSDVDLSDWYIQRKTATGSSFGSLVTSTQLTSKTIKTHGYFLVSRNQLEKSDIVAGSLVLTESNTIRIRDSKGNDIDQVAWGSIDEGKSYQRTSSSVWQVATPTPGGSNSLTQSASDAVVGTQAVSTTATSNILYYPVEPQIFTKITVQTQTVSVGAATTFAGRVWGLKKEPIENARMVWAFGDGASAEGASVEHTYYYPGEYTVILDASSGYYAASNRVRIIAVLPLVTLRTGGDEARSFVAVENRGGDELDLSGWKVESAGKTFTIPKNTLIGAHKTLTLASEITGLATPTGSTASLHFPNGTVVPAQDTLVHEKLVPVQVQNSEKSAVVAREKKQVPVKQIPTQTASIATAFSEIPTSKESSLWMWYVGVVFLAAFALLGLRLMRTSTASDAVTADDFEIIDEDENEKDDLF